MDEELRALLEALFAQQDATMVASRQRPRPQIPSRQQMAARQRGPVGNFFAEALGGAQEGTFLGSLFPRIERDDFREIPAAHLASLIGAAVLEPGPGEGKVALKAFRRMFRNPSELPRIVTEMGPQFEQAVMSSPTDELLGTTDDLISAMLGTGSRNETQVASSRALIRRISMELNERAAMGDPDAVRAITGSGINPDNITGIVGSNEDLDLIRELLAKSQEETSIERFLRAASSSADDVEEYEAMVNFLMNSRGGG